jgi:uncharacterized surface protein with fasciclin (FAS1) repeats
MKSKRLVTYAAAITLLVSCGNPTQENTESTGQGPSVPLTGQSGVQDETSRPNIVQVAAGSPDHSTLVAAVKAADLVDALSNAGPFTVFAPVNSAFDKLPAGTVEILLKPESKDDLSNILGYHTYVGVLNTNILRDGLQFDMVFGGKIKISNDGNRILINDKAEILSSINTSNGVIHVINEVLLPPG